MSFLFAVLAARPLALQGPRLCALRRSVAGRFLKIQDQVPAEPGAPLRESWGGRLIVYNMVNIAMVNMNLWLMVSNL